MILLDTNVVSELMRGFPDPAVVAWIRKQPPLRLFLCAPSEAELRYGVAVRRDAAIGKVALIPGGDRRSM